MNGNSYEKEDLKNELKFLKLNESVNFFFKHATLTQTKLIELGSLAKDESW